MLHNARCWTIIVIQALLYKIIGNIAEITLKHLHLPRFQKSDFKQVFHLVVTYKRQEFFRQVNDL